MNYEFLRQCVASAPVTPMLPDTWERILGRVPKKYQSSPLTSPLLPQLHSEVKSKYEDTIRRTTGKHVLDARVKYRTFVYGCV